MKGFLVVKKKTGGRQTLVIKKWEVAGDSKELQSVDEKVYSAWFLSVTKSDTNKEARIAEEKTCIPSEAIIPIKTLTDRASRCHVSLEHTSSHRLVIPHFH